MKDKDLLKLLLKNGWTITRIHGSHHNLKKGIKEKLYRYTVKMFP